VEALDIGSSIPERLRVLVLANYPPLGGIPKAEVSITSAIAKYIAKDDAHIVWLFPSDSTAMELPYPDRPERLRALGVDCRTYASEFSMRGLISGIGKILRGWPPSTALHVWKYMRPHASSVHELIHAFRPHLIHLAGPMAATLFKGVCGIPSVYQAMDSFSFGESRGTLGADRRFWSLLRRISVTRLEKDLYKKKDAIVFVSEADAYHASSFYSGAVHVIPLGCYTDRFHQADPLEKASTPRVIFVGSADYPPNKEAIEIVIRNIAPRIWEDFPLTEFRFVGEKTDKCAEQYGLPDARLHFTGYVRDLGRELRASWMALHPIKSGSGMLNKTLDAMASGLPVVGLEYAFRGLPKLSGAVLCRDAQDCVGAVRRLLADESLRIRLGAEARKEAEAMAWSTRVKDYLKLWHSLAHSANHRTRPLIGET
jgi:glycosyltransferase involved in cell wall biosynthesis